MAADGRVTGGTVWIESRNADRNGHNRSVFEGTASGQVTSRTPFLGTITFQGSLTAYYQINQQGATNSFPGPGAWAVQYTFSDSGDLLLCYGATREACLRSPVATLQK